MSQKIAFGKKAAAQKPIIAHTIVEGPVWHGLLTFFFPILLGAFFQQAYNTVDAVVVGQFLVTYTHEEDLSRAIYTAMTLSFWVGIGMPAIAAPFERLVPKEIN